MPELVGEVEDIYLKATGGRISDPLIVESLRELEVALDEDGANVEFVNFKMGTYVFPLLNLASALSILGSLNLSSCRSLHVH